MMPTNPLLLALAEARRRAAPMFVKWCELNGVSALPAKPADVARFVSDCAALGIERLWPALQDVSNMHREIGLADPTLGGTAASAVDKVAAVVPPRSWPNAHKLRFKSLPYDLQVFVASHEAQRERAIRRAQNETAGARQQLASYQQARGEAAHAPKTQKVEADESNPHSSA